MVTRFFCPYGEQKSAITKLIETTSFQCLIDTLFDVFFSGTPANPNSRATSSKILIGRNHFDWGFDGT